MSFGIWQAAVLEKQSSNSKDIYYKPRSDSISSSASNMSTLSTSTTTPSKSMIKEANTQLSLMFEKIKDLEAALSCKQSEVEALTSKLNEVLGKNKVLKEQLEQNDAVNKEKDLKHQNQLISYQKECQKQLDVMKEGCTKQLSEMYNSITQQQKAFKAEAANLKDENSLLKHELISTRSCLLEATKDIKLKDSYLQRLLLNEGIIETLSKLFKDIKTCQIVPDEYLPPESILESSPCSSDGGLNKFDINIPSSVPQSSYNNTSSCDVSGIEVFNPDNSSVNPDISPANPSNPPDGLRNSTVVVEGNIDTGAIVNNMAVVGGDHVRSSTVDTEGGDHVRDHVRSSTVDTEGGDEVIGAAGEDCNTADHNENDGSCTRNNPGLNDHSSIPQNDKQVPEDHVNDNIEQLDNELKNDNILQNTELVIRNADVLLSGKRPPQTFDGFSVSPGGIPGQVYRSTQEMEHPTANFYEDNSTLQSDI